MFNRSLFLLFFLGTTLFSKTILIGAATNLSTAIKPLVKGFKKEHKDQDIDVIFGSSGKLFAQLLSKAPYSIFLSANGLYPEKLYQKNPLLPKPKVFAIGSLTLLVHHSLCPKKPKKNPLEILKHASFQRFALPNPTTAPYGEAGVSFLKKVQLYQRLKPKIVYGNSVSKTLFLILNGTKIGLVSTSSIPLLKKRKEKYCKFQISKDKYLTIKQKAILLKKDGEDFYHFLFSSRAKAIFKKYGYTIND